MIFDWSDEKNHLLKNSERKMSFEEIVIALEWDGLIDIIESPTHRGQSCFVVQIADYVYVVPYVEDGEKIFLKTIYPSRKFTKYYLSSYE